MTRAEFQTIYDQGPEATFALVQSLLEAVASLSARLKELEERLNKDSHNSSKPPSSDDLAKKPRSLPNRSGAPPGAQPGHPGTTLCLTDEPDQITVHSPAACCCCGLCLDQVSSTGFERRQVHDLPPLSLRVTEHRALSKVCPACQAMNRAAFPAGVSQPAQYGPHIKALGVYLQQYQLLPYERTSELLSDLFGSAPAQGTLATAFATCYERLGPIESAIKAAVTGAPVAHFDETGTRIDGKLNWLHSASTQRLTCYAHHEKRGKAAINALGVLPAFSGTAIHDASASYLGYEDCAHALCNAHLLRELIALQEQSGQPWTGELIDLLLEIKQTVDTTKARGGTHLTSACLNDFEARYQALVAEVLAANPAPPPSGKRGRTRQSAAKNLLDRLDAHRASVLAFMYHFSVPFDNNLAERDLRMVKVRQKVSGGFRSAESASLFCRIRGYISTLRKQGCDILSALQSVFEGNPFVPALQA